MVCIIVVVAVVVVVVVVVVAAVVGVVKLLAVLLAIEEPTLSYGVVCLQGVHDRRSEPIVV